MSGSTKKDCFPLTMEDDSGEKLSLGHHTFQIPLALYQTNRQRLLCKLKNADEGSVVILQGGSEIPKYDTDTTYVFKQESYFLWCFGVTEADCFGVMEVGNKQSHLFFPRLPKEYGVWMGPLKKLDEFQQKYGVEHVHYVDELPQVLKSIKAKTLLTLVGQNSDSGLRATGATFKGIESFRVNSTTLFPIIANLRSIKTDYEIDVIKYVVNLSSDAHKYVMKMVRAGIYEYQCEASFLHYCYHNGGCRHEAYTCICGSGINSSVLHYGHAGAPNNYRLRDGDMCLFDMGAEYFGYAADITVSFPVNGKFTPKQKIIYEAVLNANNAVQTTAGPGKSWSEMHLLANRVLLEGLKKGGLVTGSIDNMLQANIATIFQPHGLGHLLGLDVHDVGGYLEGHPARSNRPGLKNLRTARILEKNMVLTIEPGCYFIDTLLDDALADPEKSKFLVKDVIESYRGFGGVRIEDDVLVTEYGVENLTKVPRTISEIEEFMIRPDDNLRVVCKKR